ncbi:DUF4276 family protein [Pseudofrankia inefficax]|uniref:DUF4276 family protein n=1 Tax=Pseudofrankia inefficax (strain DSM 45817 / CECT 9037 / DDB 130130 / EuI1c) TaxID=298654 RepID=E3J5S1_PSEI1|nr:DUF4276 family protein [Pseudofrankia inefficax]ADP83158.1 hypothetical protein FraEuI1c_5169 [Pseudofrankia inefficax]
MRIALLVEGIGEFKALPRLIPSLEHRSGQTLLQPVQLNVHPLAPPNVIASSLAKKMQILEQRRADQAVLLLDREDAEECPGTRAEQVATAIAKHPKITLPVQVVLKDRTLENWLIADLTALRTQPGRFKVTEALTKRVEPDKADRLAAIDLLQSASIGRTYHKVDDAVEICARLDPARAARHSRSFRHLLHVLGDSTFDAGCRRPPDGLPVAQAHAVRGPFQ